MFDAMSMAQKAPHARLERATLRFALKDKMEQLLIPRLLKCKSISQLRLEVDDPPFAPKQKRAEQ